MTFFSSPETLGGIFKQILQEIITEKKGYTKQ